jgi:hypothetical protein
MVRPLDLDALVRDLQSLHVPLHRGDGLGLPRVELGRQETHKRSIPQRIAILFKQCNGMTRGEILLVVEESVMCPLDRLLLKSSEERTSDHGHRAVGFRVAKGEV